MEVNWEVRGVPGMSSWEEAPRKTQDTVEDYDGERRLGLLGIDRWIVMDGWMDELNSVFKTNNNSNNNINKYVVWNRSLLLYMLTIIYNGDNGDSDRECD